MKNTTNILLAGLIFVLLIAATKEHSLNLNLSEYVENTITISGTAEKDVAPDTASITFAVNEYDKDQKIAANTVNTKTKSIVDALKDLDIEEKDIQTNNYSVSPQYNWNDGTRTFANYRVSQSVQVTIRDLEIVPAALAKIVELDVDNVNGPNMYIEDLDKIKDGLREEAINDAKKKAKELASELGVSLDKIVGFSEYDNNRYLSSTYKMETVSMDMGDMDDIAEPEINAGEETIIKNVSITFQIVD